MMHRITSALRSAAARRSRLAAAGAALSVVAVLAPSSASAAWEPVPANYAANHRVPTAAELARYRASQHSNCAGSHAAKVTGNFTGTTDEILQWAARKWGIDPNVPRGMAVRESHWIQSAVGDHGQSFGILQIKASAHPGTYPLSRLSTAFNADYTMNMIRQVLDGCATWLRGDYRAGNLWGSVGYWNTGSWYTRSSRARTYIAHVQEAIAAQAWLHM
jgi:hypothetical protein